MNLWEASIYADRHYSTLKRAIEMGLLKAKTIKHKNKTTYEIDNYDVDEYLKFYKHIDNPVRYEIKLTREEQEYLLSQVKNDTISIFFRKLLWNSKKSLKQ